MVKRGYIIIFIIFSVSKFCFAKDSKKGEDHFLRKLSLQVKTLSGRSNRNLPTIRIEKVYKLLKSRNINLQVLRQKMVQAELESAKAWSYLKPQLLVRGIYNRNNLEVKLLDYVLTPKDHLILMGEMRWAFFNPQLIPILQMGSLVRRRMRFTMKRVIRDILFGATRLYYGILLSSGMVKISRDNLASAEAHLKMTRNRLEGGVSLRLELNRAQLDVTTARQELLQAKNALEKVRLSLALLLNRANFSYRVKRPIALKLPSGDLVKWRRMALRNRFDLKSARVMVEVAKKALQKELLSFLPILSLNSSLQGQNVKGFSGRNFNWNVSVVAQINLYNGGLRFLKIKKARAKLFEAKLKLGQSLRKINNDLALAAMEYINVKNTIKVARQRHLLAKSNYIFTKNQYQAGLVTSTKVLDALKMYRAAQIAMLMSELNVDIAIIKLRRVIGIFNP